MTSAARRTVGALLLALAASLLVVGPAPAAGTTSVTGTITIAGDPSTPVNGYVYFYQEPWSSAGGVALTNGAFTAPTQADGDYKIRVLVTTMDNRSVWYAGPGNPAGVETIDQAPLLTLDGTALDLTMELAQIGRVTGTVTRAGGAPVGQVSVQRSRQGMVASAITNAQGEFDFGYVRPSPPDLSVSVNAGAGLAGDQQSVTVPATGEVVVDLVMVDEARIGGTLVDEDSGDPIEYLSVSAFRKADQAYIGGDRTDADGRFTIGGLGETGYVLRYADDLGGYPQTWNGGADLLVDAPPLTPTAGATLSHDEALTQVADPCQQPDTCLLSGVVEDGSGAPLAAIDVTAYDADGVPVASDATDRSGRWGIGGIGDGEYRLGFGQGSVWYSLEPDLVEWFPEFHPDGWGLAQATPVSAGAASPVTGLSTTLARAARLGLTVKGPAGTGEVAAGYRVVDAATGVTVHEVAVGTSSGNRLDVPLREGTWKILVSGRRTSGAQLLSQWYGGGATLAAAPTVTAVAGSVVTLSRTTRLPGTLSATTAPKVRGTPRVGSTLKATTGRWNLMTDTTFRFRWKRGSTLVGKTASHVVTRGDAGKVLTVTVTARNGELVTRVPLRVTVAR